MSDFQLFSQVFTKYMKKEKEAEIDTSTTHCQEDGCQEDCRQEDCHHENLCFEKGTSVCLDCGEEIEKTISNDREMKYYGNDTKKTMEPNRVRLRHIEEKNIYKDVEGLNFSGRVVEQANRLYIEVTKGKIFRGESRKSIVFACIFLTYKFFNKPISHESLIKIFKIKQKTCLKGIKYVSLNSTLKTTSISPLVLIDEIMDKFDAGVNDKQEVKDLYIQIKNKSIDPNRQLNRSRPQSIASGLVYYWICQKQKNISIEKFAETVKLSNLTINKISKEIASILEEK